MRYVRGLTLASKSTPTYAHVSLHRGGRCALAAAIVKVTSGVGPINVVGRRWRAEFTLPNTSAKHIFFTMQTRSVCESEFYFMSFSFTKHTVFTMPQRKIIKWKLSLYDTFCCKTYSAYNAKGQNHKVRLVSIEQHPSMIDKTHFTL